MLSTDQLRAVIERGDKATSLLSNAAFLGIVDELTTMHLSALVAAPPGDAGREARDYHHLMQHSLTELVQTLQGYADAGEATKQALGSITDDDDLDAPYEDTETE